MPWELENIDRSAEARFSDRISASWYALQSIDSRAWLSKSLWNRNPIEDMRLPGSSSSRVHNAGYLLAVCLRRLANLLGGPRLADVLIGRDNNLNAIRMVAATSVLVSHAYPITRGPTAVEPLRTWIGISLGNVAVAVFFVISGLLVAQSWERSGGLARYTTARMLRIFPGLAAVLLLTVAVLGPAVTALTIPDYATRLETWSYLPRNLLLLRMQIPCPACSRASLTVRRSTDRSGPSSTRWAVTWYSPGSDASARSASRARSPLERPHGSCCASQSALRESSPTSHA